MSVRHQTGRQQAPKQRLGYGESTVKPDEESKDFAFDQGSGLFLPEAAAKAKRKVEIGFGRSAQRR